MPTDSTPSARDSASCAACWCLQSLPELEPAAVFRVLRHLPDWMAELDVQALREASEEFSVVRRDMATLKGPIKLLQEEIGARRSARPRTAACSC